MLFLPPVFGDVPPPFAVSYDLLALAAVVALVVSIVFLIRRKKKR